VYEAMNQQLPPLKRARHDQGWSQEQAIVRIEALGRAMRIPLPTRSSLRTLVSLFENQRRGVPEQYRPIFRELYRSTDEQLGMTSSPAALAPPVPPALPDEVPDAPGPEILTYLSNVLDEHIKADAVVGPRYLVGPVQSQLPLLDRLCRASRGQQRETILSIAARSAEFCGWLYQDSGHPESALYWTNQALDYGQELGDAQLIAYVLHRKSNIVTEAGQAGHGLGLANAALKVSKALTSRVRAVALRQQARAYAILAETSAFEKAIN
jgi:hypothetical protein